MKTTIEIADDLFERAQEVARKEKTTFRALAEQGLRMVLKEKHRGKPKKLPPLVTYGGSGLTNEFKDWNWDRIRDEIYRGRAGLLFLGRKNYGLRYRIFCSGIR
jgi:hypothetical protein